MLTHDERTTQVVFHLGQLTVEQRDLRSEQDVRPGITLGGLIHDRATDVATQVPVLGDIPIFGKAFQHKDNIIEKTELVIILTPRVVRDLNEARAAAVVESSRKLL